MHVCACGGHTRVSDPLEPPAMCPELRSSIMSLARLSCLIELGATASASVVRQQAFGGLPVSYPSPRLQLCAATPGFCAAPGDLNSGPCLCTANAIPTELSPHSQDPFFPPKGRWLLSQVNLLAVGSPVHPSPVCD